MGLNRFLSSFLVMVILFLSACTSPVSPAQTPLDPSLETENTGEISEPEKEESDDNDSPQLPAPSAEVTSIPIIEAISDAQPYSARNHAHCAVDSLRSSVPGGLWYSGDVTADYLESDFGPNERAITLVLGETVDLTSVRIRFYQGGSSADEIVSEYGRKYYFFIQASADGKEWSFVYPSDSALRGTLAVSDCLGELETFECSFEKANYVRIIGAGSDGGSKPLDWKYFAIRQIEVYGHSYGTGGGNAIDGNGFVPLTANPKGGESAKVLNVKKPITVYFIRHGQSDYSVSTNATAHLNARGYMQSYAIADYFSSREIDAVFTSPYQRCVDTVEPLCDLLGTEATVNQDIYERTIGSEVEYAPSGFVAAQWVDFSYKLNGGESLYEVQTRMIRGLGSIFRTAEADEDVDTILISSHAAALSVILNVYANEKGSEIYTRLHTMGTPCVKCVFVDNTCVEMEFIDIPG